MSYRTVIIPKSVPYVWTCFKFSPQNAVAKSLQIALLQSVVKNKKRGSLRVSASEKNKEILIEDTVNVLIPRLVGDRDE
jgi:hypothetical protein